MLQSGVKGYVPVDTVIIAMLIAAVVTFVIKKIWNLVRAALRHPAELGYSYHSLLQIMERCRAMFPLETFIFHGKQFHRGMKIRVTTLNRKTFEGELVGINEDNVLCVVSKDSIAADTLEHIAEIALLDDAHKL